MVPDVFQLDFCGDIIRQKGGVGSKLNTQTIPSLSRHCPHPTAIQTPFDHYPTVIQPSSNHLQS